MKVENNKSGVSSERVISEIDSQAEIIIRDYTHDSVNPIDDSSTTTAKLLGRMFTYGDYDKMTSKGYTSDVGVKVIDTKWSGDDLLEYLGKSDFPCFVAYSKCGKLNVAKLDGRSLFSVLSIHA